MSKVFKAIKVIKVINVIFFMWCTFLMTCYLLEQDWVWAGVYMILSAFSFSMARSKKKHVKSKEYSDVWIGMTVGKYRVIGYYNLLPEDDTKLIEFAYTASIGYTSYRMKIDLPRVFEVVWLERRMDEHVNEVLKGKAQMRPPKSDLPIEKHYAGAIRGWRLWYVNANNELTAITRSHVWHAGPNLCNEIPQLGLRSTYGYGGDAGFYAFNDLKLFETQEKANITAFRRGQEKDAVGTKVVIGSVLCYGRVVRAKDGYRAEVAVPEYMILPDMNADWQYQVLTLADKYQMKTITIEQAKELKCGLVPYAIPEEQKDAH